MKCIKEYGNEKRQREIERRRERVVGRRKQRHTEQRNIYIYIYIYIYEGWRIKGEGEKRKEKDRQRWGGRKRGQLTNGSVQGKKVILKGQTSNMAAK